MEISVFENELFIRALSTHQLCMMKCVALQTIDVLTGRMCFVNSNIVGGFCSFLYIVFDNKNMSDWDLNITSVSSHTWDLNITSVSSHIWDLNITSVSSHIWDLNITSVFQGACSTKANDSYFSNLPISSIFTLC